MVDEVTPRVRDLLAANIRDADRIRTLEDMLKRAANQFDSYAELHAAKDTKDGDKKAEVNRTLAEEIRSALQN